ncbi:MAG: hypothetical protein L0287_20420 [Anaerolineae bacterium]|nr:hypothetical protein [Anaerolineae bacterium]
MHRLYAILLILSLALAGCAPSANPQSKEVKAVDNSAPADLSEQSNPADSAKSETVSKDSPTDCPLTIPQDPLFTPPAPYSDLGFEGEFWYGSNSLWTAVPQNGVWAGLPHNPEGYTQKVFWWREGYVWTDEPEPDLIVTGERLDASAPPLIASKATNAYASDIGSAMLVGVDFPTLGCWKITGQYKKTELSFVVWVAP